jgi:uncharacterized protein YdhG (YjbR/CyaY superfamily)
MLTQKKKFTTMDEYITTFPEDVQGVLEKIRRTIRKTVPAADETISYQIPTFKLDGKYLVYFAGYKNHVSLYPIPSGKEILKELAPYKAGKGTVRFPLDEPIPYDLVKKIVTFRLSESQDTKK